MVLVRARLCHGFVMQGAVTFSLRIGVKQPIWGPIWQTTLHDMTDAEASISLALLAEPRLEPEIVIGLTESPPPQADASTPEALATLLACIGWVAPGFEVVHSIWPNWRFNAAQAIAARGERIAAGSVVTTGTLTDAQPLSAGQHWRTAIDGAPLSGLSLKVNA
jgi:2-keto-4-pentenoate hydratase